MYPFLVYFFLGDRVAQCVIGQSYLVSYFTNVNATNNHGIRRRTILIPLSANYEPAVTHTNKINNNNYAVTIF